MNIDDLTVGQVKKLQALLGGATPNLDPEHGTPVIVRCRDAGVHYGEFAGRSGRTVKLTNARRCWRFWTGGIGSCSELAVRGLERGKENRIGDKVSSVVLTESCEVLPCTATSAASMAEVNGPGDGYGYGYGYGDG